MYVCFLLIQGASPDSRHQRTMKKPRAWLCAFCKKRNTGAETTCKVCTKQKGYGIFKMPEGKLAAYWQAILDNPRMLWDRKQTISTRDAIVVRKRLLLSGQFCLEGIIAGKYASPIDLNTFAEFCESEYIEVCSLFHSLVFLCFYIFVTYIYNI